MKKFLVKAVMAVMVVCGLVACNDGENYSYGNVVVCRGIVVGNAGNQSDGSLTFFDYSTKKATTDQFSAVNNRTMGGGISDIVLYGSKFYAVVSGDDAVEVMDVKTYKSIKKVSTKGVASEPRKAIAYGGKIYVSTHSSKVVVIDTLTNEISKTIDCGSLSEGLCVHGDYIYVANAGNGSGDASITKISLSTEKTETIKNENIINPVNVLSVQGRLFYVDNGSIDEKGDQVNYGLFELSSNGSSTFVLPATIATKGFQGNIYLINAPKSEKAVSPSYTIYNAITGRKDTFISGSDIYAPCAIAVDPYFGYVVVSSYNLNAQTQTPDYAANGYAIIYSSDGKQNLQKFATGVGPACISFNLGIEFIKY